MEKKILDILAEICDDDIVRENLDINLLDEDLIDSLDYIEILLEIENACDIVMSPTEFTREEMDTPRKIITQVEARLK